MRYHPNADGHARRTWYGSDELDGAFLLRKGQGQSARASRLRKGRTFKASQALAGRHTNGSNAAAGRAQMHGEHTATDAFRWSVRKSRAGPWLKAEQTISDMLMPAVSSAGATSNDVPAGKAQIHLN